jgi:hypothetical protein
MTVDVKKLYREIANDEGKVRRLVLHCYLCSESHKTIGIGHNHKGLLETDEEQALEVYGAICA